MKEKWKLARQEWDNGDGNGFAGKGKGQSCDLVLPFGSETDPCTSSVSVIWELARNASLWTSSQSDWISNSGDRDEQFVF